MTEFLESTLNIVSDGELSINEVILMAILVVLLLLVFVIIKGIIKKIYNTYGPGKKKTIFSHRKNQYKTKIAKGKRMSKKNKFQ